jgi:hypothetical protein
MASQPPLRTIGHDDINDHLIGHHLIGHHLGMAPVNPHFLCSDMAVPV